MRYLLCFLLITVLSVAAPSVAQTDDVVVIAYGEIFTGQINDLTARAVYQFDALRCDFISVRLTATSGNLDPVLTLFDDTGASLLSLDDTGGELDAEFDPLLISENGRYTIVVGRFGYELGDTYGAYEILVERIGNSSDSGCGLRYGDSVHYSIDDSEPEIFYFFRARQGEIINIRMQRRSGDLDPYLRVVGSDSIVLEENDDTLGPNTDAEIQALMIPADGTYYIIASRYGDVAGDSSGTFMLTLQETADSGLGNSSQAAINIRPDTTIEGTLSNVHYLHYYRFEARKDDIITVRMERLTGSLDSYLMITNSVLFELIANDDTEDSVNSLILDYMIPSDGTYYIVATRFDGEAGSTTGRYRLRLLGRGNAFDGVPIGMWRITYGSVLTGTVDDVTPETFYAFRGEAGDTITVSMNLGDGGLDPYLRLWDDERDTVMVSNDDGGNHQNALIESYVLPYTGIYYIEATRYDGADNPNTIGSYTLVLAQRFDNP